MKLTLHIEHTSDSEINALFEYLNSLKFVTIEGESQLSPEQMDALSEARSSYEENGGRNHKEVMEEMKQKYPNVFK